MVQSVEYAPGTPSWVDLGSPDVDAAARFYGSILGWETVAAGGEEAGGYRFFTLGGRIVAGVGPLQGDGQPPAWTTYVSVADADAAAAGARAAGGTVLLEPLDVMSAGRMAVLGDPAGAVIAVWQPGETRGAELVGEPGSMCWHELACRDPEPARTFYGELFGWGAETSAYDDTTYTEWKLGDRTVGGMIQMNEMWPPEVPAHWMVYFAVEDADAVAARTAEMGGTVSVPPTDIPPGRFAVLGDPHGAFFSVLRLAMPPG